MGVPTEAQQPEALRRLLVGIARGVDANDLAVDLGDLHVRQNTFPGEVFMALAAHALELAGVDRSRSESTDRRGDDLVEVLVGDRAARQLPSCALAPIGQV